MRFSSSHLSRNLTNSLNLPSASFLHASFLSGWNIIDCSLNILRFVHCNWGSLPFEGQLVCPTVTLAARGGAAAVGAEVAARGGGVAAVGVEVGTPGICSTAFPVVFPPAASAVRGTVLSFTGHIQIHSESVVISLLVYL